MAEPKEVLISFGGVKTIQQYRNGFMTILSLDLLFKSVADSSMQSNLNSITKDISTRLWTYTFQCKKRTENKKEEEQTDVGRPTVHKKTAKYKALFG